MPCAFRELARLELLLPLLLFLLLLLLLLLLLSSSSSSSPFLLPHTIAFLLLHTSLICLFISYYIIYVFSWLASELVRWMTCFSIGFIFVYAGYRCVCTRTSRQAWLRLEACLRIPTGRPAMSFPTDAFSRLPSKHIKQYIVIPLLSLYL